jgi:endonuclease/exonuclease/phosphatase (EEP) superfamily protein YafD
MLARTDGPVVVGGDFNMTERSQDYAMIAKMLNDAYRSAGVGLGHTFPRCGAYPRTFPSPFPTLRLDYIWHSDHLVAAWAHRGDAGDSDHHPVVTGLRWADAPALRLDGSTVPLAASAV